MEVFCTYCSRKKDDRPGELPAVSRYLGSRIPRVAAAASHLGLRMFILSGKYGLINAHHPLPWYDHELQPEEVADMIGAVAASIERHGISGIAYFTRPVARDSSLRPYLDVMVGACERSAIPVLVIEL